MEVTTKVCHKCQKEQSIACFSKHSGTKDKLDNRCKECVKNIKRNNKEHNTSKEYPVIDLDLTCREWQVGKPTGTILERSTERLDSIAKRYEVRIALGNAKTKSKSFAFDKYESPEKAYQAANEWLICKSNELNLTRNMIKILDENTIEVMLTKDQIMKTDISFADLCQKYSLVSTKSGNATSEYYAAISINNKLIPFHKYITKYDMTDHINRDPLDNRLVNLKKTSAKLNNNNRGPPKKYKDDPNHILGVRFMEKQNAWQAFIKQDDEIYSKTYSVSKYGNEEAKKKAIAARQKFNKMFDCNNC